jgi:hypothetical protein
MGWRRPGKFEESLGGDCLLCIDRNRRHKNRVVLNFCRQRPHQFDLRCGDDANGRSAPEVDLPQISTRAAAGCLRVAE